MLDLDFAHRYAQWLGVTMTFVPGYESRRGRSNPQDTGIYVPEQGLLLVQQGALSPRLARKGREYWLVCILHELNHYAIANRAMRRYVDFGLLRHTPLSQIRYRYGPTVIDVWSEHVEGATVDLDLWVLDHIGTPAQREMWRRATLVWDTPDFCDSKAPHRVLGRNGRWTTLTPTLLETFSGSPVRSLQT